MGKFKDLTGQKFGRLTVIENVGSDKHKKALWKVRCECGKEKVVVGSDLSTGHTKSCGCLNREVTSERFRTHGMKNTSTYNIWCVMKNRCYNPNYKRFHDYGGRGIRICERWLESFENFLEDMGERPEGMSIDRIDNNGHYTPENCRWATQSEQNRNTRRNVLITYNDETLCSVDWAERLGTYEGTIRYRYHHGWTPEECLFGRTKSNSPQEDE